ncbi:hypothetical protein EXN66_Car016059 [Channa argus]|uniref:Uncharacterized protein n=1 Tax=Channa argus TaxID=215402 RepID=A0A6G1QCU7_CHAAH|nr:hypothetical protein EXN66_Car016059 [Channa argus]
MWVTTWVFDPNTNEAKFCLVVKSVGPNLSNACSVLNLYDEGSSPLTPQQRIISFHLQLLLLFLHHQWCVKLWLPALLSPGSHNTKSWKVMFKRELQEIYLV